MSRSTIQVSLDGSRCYVGAVSFAVGAGTVDRWLRVATGSMVAAAARSGAWRFRGDAPTLVWMRRRMSRYNCAEWLLEGHP